MTLSSSEISEMIKNKIPDAEIEIEDLRGDNNHYHAKIRSKEFRGLTKIEQHNYLFSLQKVCLVTKEQYLGTCTLETLQKSRLIEKA